MDVRGSSLDNFCGNCYIIDVPSLGILVCVAPYSVKKNQVYIVPCFRLFKNPCKDLMNSINESTRGWSKMAK